MAVEVNQIAELLNNALQDSSMFLPGNCHKIDSMFNTCLRLFERDNICTLLTNDNGILCGTYPAKIVVPLCQIDDHKRNLDEYGEATNLAVRQYKELTAKGRLARTRGRFPVPSVLIGNKFICRSSTLANSIEMYVQDKYHYWFQSSSAQHEHLENGASHDPNNGLTGEHHAVRYSKKDSNDSTTGMSFALKKSQKNPLKLLKYFTKPAEDDDQSEWLLQKMRKTDIDVLHRLKVNVICDLMVENKKAKYGFYVTSSEKVDRLNRYKDFEVISIPYPGCEFFTDYSRNDYTCSGLKFDWDQSFIDAKLHVPSNDLSKIVGVDWSNYTDWDLVFLTQNYLKLMLNCLVSSKTSGVLVHCISGWDRTPLFVSLLRLSLWADGLIHQSLNAEEMVYLTLAYDWLMFNHQFYDRINRNEEIMHFCFEFLKFLVTEDFSVLPLTQPMESPFFYCDNNEAAVNGSKDMIGGASTQSSKVTKEKLNPNASIDQSSTVSDDVEACLDSVVSTIVANTTLDISGQLENLRINNEGRNKISSKSLHSSHSPINNRDVTEVVSSVRHDSFFNDSNAFTSSDASLDSNGMNFSSNMKEKIDAVLEVKLEKRREKLMSARNIFTSAYCSVVPKHKEIMQQRSGISGFVGSWGASIVNFVKRN